VVRTAVEAAVRSAKHPFRNGKVLARVNPYDLIILNGKMPGMNGIEVAFECLTVGYNVHFDI
jgi:CheY-like chemotaxis protein